MISRMFYAMILVLPAIPWVYAGNPGDFGIRQVVFSFRTDDPAEFERYSRLAKKVGATHIDVSELPEKAWWQKPDPKDPYPQWAYINNSIFKSYIPEGLRGHIPAKPQEQLLATMQERCRILRKLGLKGYFKGGEPMMLPESVYEEHPLWRGPQVDNPDRSVHAQFAPAVDNPEVKALYREAMAGLILACPEIEIFRFLSNDSGAGFGWTRVYPGVNGNHVYSHISTGERVAGFMGTLQKGAQDAGARKGVVIAVNAPGHESWTSDTGAQLKSLGGGMVLGNRLADGSLWSTVTGSEYYFNAMFPLLGIPQHLRFIRELEGAVNRKTPVLIVFADLEMEELHFQLFERFFDHPTQSRLSRQQFLHDYATEVAGKARALEMTEIWNNLADSVEAHWPINYGWYGGHVFILATAAHRWLNRPFVPFPTELEEEEYSYYRPYLWNVGSIERKENLAYPFGFRIFEGQAVSRLISTLFSKAIGHIDKARGGVSSVLDNGPGGELENELELLDIRLQAYRLVCKNARHAVAYQEKLDYVKSSGFEADPNPRFNLEPQPMRQDLYWMARAEMDNTAQLIELLESTDQPIIAMASDPKNEDSFHYGPNFVDTLRKKLKIMRAHWCDYDRFFDRP